MLAIILAAWFAFGGQIHRGDISKSRFFSWPSMIAARTRLIAFTIILFSFAGTLAVVWILRAFPNSADEYGYLYEADTFLARRLWNPLPPHHEFFSFLHIFEKNGKWVSEYPPGWSLILAFGRLLHIPYWMVCPLVGVLFLYTVWRLAERQAGELCGILALALVASSPFFLFNAASYFNVLPTATAGLLFCWAMLEFLDSHTLVSALAAGAALGFVGLTRSFDAILFGVPFFIQFIRTARRPHCVTAPFIIVGGLPFLAVLLITQYAVTGSALTSVTSWGYPKFKLGFFPSDQLGNQSTPLLQICFAAYNILDLARWTSPIMVLGYLAVTFWKIRSRSLSLLDMIFPWVVICYLLYVGLGGNRYGPRMYLIGFPFLAVTLASVLTPALDTVSEPRQFTLASGLLAGHFTCCLIGALILGVFFRHVVNVRMEIYDEVRAQSLHDAVVIVHSGGGAYLPFTPEDLTRNGITLDGRNVIYARDIPGKTAILREMFPDRGFFIFSRKNNSSRGELTRLMVRRAAGRQ